MQLNKIYNESCLDTMKRMEDGFVDLTVTSPPYNMRTRVRNGKYTTRETSEHFSKKYKFFPDALSITDYFAFHKDVLSELMRVSKMTLWNFSVVTGSKEAIFRLVGEFALHIKDVIVWDKGHGQPAMHEGCINRATELILVLEGNPRAGRTLSNFNFPRGEMDDIWRIKRQKRLAGIHGATFPDALAEKAILGFSKEGDLVYDPFFGSGTTGKMASLNNRKWIGSEIVNEYCAIAEKRLLSSE